MCSSDLKCGRRGGLSFAQACRLFCARPGARTLARGIASDANEGWCPRAARPGAGGRRGGSPVSPPTRRPMPAEPAAALPPRSAPRSEHAARCECSVSETPRAAADRDAAALRKTPWPPRRPGKEKGSFERNASPGFSPPHAASRTLFRTKKSVRSDAHYVGRTGLRFSRVVFPWPESKGQQGRAALWPILPCLPPGASRASRGTAAA